MKPPFHASDRSQDERGAAATDLPTASRAAEPGVGGGSLIQRIHRIHDALPAGERQAADRILQAPGELAMCSASELAARAEVSAATVSRLFRRLGYASFDEARRASRTLLEAGSPLFRAPDPQEEQDGDETRGALARHQAAEGAVIDATFSRQDAQAVTEAAHLLAEAPRVLTSGFRNSYFVAEYARMVFSCLRPGVQLLNRNGQTPAEALGDVREGDVALLIGLRRRPRWFMNYLETLTGCGAVVILLADGSIRQPNSARVTLSCAVGTPQIFDTPVGAFALTRLLASEAELRLGEPARERIRRIELLHEAVSDLEQGS